MFKPTSTSVTIAELRLPCRVGVGEAERSGKQTVLVDLECDVQYSTNEEDSLDSSADYTGIVARIRVLGSPDRERKTLEHLAYEIAVACFEDAKINHVSVKVRKPNKLLDVGAVGVKRNFQR